MVTLVLLSLGTWWIIKFINYRGLKKKNLTCTQSQCTKVCTYYWVSNIHISLWMSSNFTDRSIIIIGILFIFMRSFVLFGIFVSPWWVSSMKIEISNGPARHGLAHFILNLLLFCVVLVSAYLINMLCCDVSISICSIKPNPRSIYKLVVFLTCPYLNRDYH